MHDKQVKILLVDDDLGDRKLVELALKQSPLPIDFSIEYAERLDEAIQILGEKEVDFMLLDLGLPDSHGIETIDAVSYKYPRMPIIVLTGLEDEEVGAEAIKKGAYDYVTKPFQPSTFRTRIGILLERLELQKKLMNFANTDELTKLYNRRYFFDILDREMLQAKLKDRSLSVLMIDIDHFKSINDTYGHYSGDLILKQTGKIMKENIYPLDVVARYGGEEFVVMMPDTHYKDAVKAAEKMHDIFDKHLWEIPNRQISVTVSIGVAGIEPGNMMDGRELMKRADTALYAAKKQGRNRVICWSDIEPMEMFHEPHYKDYYEMQLKVSALAEQLKDQANGMISVLSRTISIVIKDPYLDQHSKNVKAYAVDIAEQLRLSEELKERIGNAALLMDLGKMSISPDILKKAGQLTEHEQDIIKQHPNLAVDILRPMNIFNLDLDIIKYHHENFDGSGYPNGLKAKEIPLGARILRIADTFDAMTSERPYSHAKDIKSALREIAAGSKTLFDPDIVEALKKAAEKNEDIWPLSKNECLLKVE